MKHCPATKNEFYILLLTGKDINDILKKKIYTVYLLNPIFSQTVVIKEPIYITFVLAYLSLNMKKVMGYLH